MHDDTRSLLAAFGIEDRARFMNVWTEEELDSKSVSELKKMPKARKLSVSGNKMALVQRLLQAEPLVLDVHSELFSKFFMKPLKVSADLKVRSSSEVNIANKLSAFLQANSGGQIRFLESFSVDCVRRRTGPILRRLSTEWRVRESHKTIISMSTSLSSNSRLWHEVRQSIKPYDALRDGKKAQEQ